MTMSATEPFVTAIENSRETLMEMAEKGHRFLGYFCTYTPVEVIDACGFIPIRISGGEGPVETANSLLPDFICPFMKRSVEKVLHGEYSYLSGLIQGYSCDAACGVTNILENQLQGVVFHSLPLPYNDNPVSRKYFNSTIRTLIEKLNTHGGLYSEANLEQSFEVRNWIREKILKLHEMRIKRTLPLSSSDLWYVIQAGYVMPPLSYQKLLGSLMKEIKGLAPYSSDGVPVLVSGSLIESVSVIDCIENNGGYLVADDLCTGQRGFSQMSDPGAEIKDQLVNRHFERIPCPTRSRAEDRLKHIEALIQQSGAKGAIFILQKFCTPHLSDFPYLSEKLRNLGIPSMLVEMDEYWNTEGQFRTRLEGFMEMLR